MPAPLTIGFIHPELGIGGAERLVLDAALALQAAGHRVIVLTARRDRRHCFPEARDGTLDVRVRGGLLPAQVLQRLRAPCAIARAAYLAAALGRLDAACDVVFCDLVAHAIPWLRRRTAARVVFYCHFPDRLLVPPRRGLLYRLYRRPIDRLEARGLAAADRVLVNSRFTAARLREAFPELRALRPAVLYPGVALPPEDDGAGARAAGDAAARHGGAGEITLLAIGRYDPRKNLGLAIAALGALRARLAPEMFARVRLVVAGGYDARLRESRATLGALRAAAARLGLEAQVALERSPGEGERRALLSRCRCVVYTPEDEHFGYVPLEAMAAGRPVVAVSHGGPTETVVHGETGLLCPPAPETFAAALARLILDPELAARMGRRGRAHVARRFSRAAFAARLEALVRALAASPARDQASRRAGGGPA